MMTGPGYHAVGRRAKMPQARALDRSAHGLSTRIARRGATPPPPAV